MVYFETVKRGRIDIYCDWEMLRTFGKLPLFGASYAALVFVPLFLFVLAWHNQKVEVVRGWAEKVESRSGQLDKQHPSLHANEVREAAAAIKDKLHPQPVPSQSLILLVSTLLLAVASTIYTIGCPSRIKEFSRDQWCDQIGKHLIHYWPLSWRYRRIRVVCALCYVIGGTGAAFVLMTKVYRAGVFIYQNSTFSIF